MLIALLGLDAKLLVEEVAKACRNEVYKLCIVSIDMRPLPASIKNSFARVLARVLVLRLFTAQG